MCWRGSPRNAMKTFSKSVTEHCYGVEIADGQTVILAEVVNGKPAVTARYGTDEDGIQALKRRVADGPVHARICVRTCGAVALAVAFALTAVPRGEVLMLTEHALERAPGAKGGMPPTPEARAERLALIAQRML